MGDILVVNAGSTSLKLDLVSEDETRRGVSSLDQVSRYGLDAVAHRVVHGGPCFREPVLIDAAVRAQVLALESVAPLHNAPALAAIEAAQRLLPDAPHVVVFDTGFHATIPAATAVYALPRHWREEWGIRRYGFHGLSVAWCAERVPEVVGHPVRRLVVCHLDGGSSVTAVLDGRSVDTTMGFTPLEGVPMTTRAGSVDPGALVFLLRQHGLGADALDHALNAQSGLRALAGGSGDVRDLEARAAAGDVDARPALDVFVHRLAGAVRRDGGRHRRPRCHRVHGRNRRALRARARPRARAAPLPGRRARSRAERGRRARLPDRQRRWRRHRRHHAREDLVAARAARRLALTRARSKETWS